MQEWLCNVLDELYALDDFVELKLPYISTGAEGVAFAGKDDHPDTAVLLDVGQGCVQVFKHLGAGDVQLLQILLCVVALSLTKIEDWHEPSLEEKQTVRILTMLKPTVNGRGASIREPPKFGGVAG